jgi:hypothetical protein
MSAYSWRACSANSAELPFATPHALIRYKQENHFELLVSLPQHSGRAGSDD